MTLAQGITPQPAVFKDVPGDVLRSVKAASARTGVDFSYLLAKAAAESGYDASARAETSSATGLYQFIDSTWIEMVRDHGAKYGLGSYAEAIEDGRLDAAARAQVLDYRQDPRLAAAMAAEYTHANQVRLETELGRPASNTDLYLAHFLGAGGAVRFLQALDAAPSIKAAALLPRAAKANEAVFRANGQDRSVGEIYDHFAAKFADTTPETQKTSRAAMAVQAEHVRQMAEADGSKNVPNAPLSRPARGGGRFAPAQKPTFFAPARPDSLLAAQALLVLVSLDPLDDGKDAI